MRVLFAGTPEVAVPSLAAVHDSPHEVVGVLTRPDAAAGRGRRVLRSAVAQWADDHGLPVLQPAGLGEPGALQAIRDLAPDGAAVVAYGALIRPDALAVPAHGWVNLHFSLLPAWRGAAPVQRALLAGDEVTGATTFALDEGLDTGPVYGVLTERVRPRDTAGELLDRLAHAGAPLLVATLDGLENGSLQPLPQPAEGVSHAPKLTVDDARLDWTAPALAVDRRVRAVTPEPGAWTTWRGERLGVVALQPVPDAETRPAAGELVVTKRAVLVGTATEPVLLDQVRPAGRRAMAAVDWARGARPDAGECLR